MTTTTRAFPAGLALLLAACATAPDGRPDPGLRLELFDGDGQTVGTEDLSAPLTVRVLDQDDTPVSGIVVHWSVTGGHGTVTPTSDTTGVIGTSSTVYRTAFESGVDTIVARLGTDDSIQFEVTVVAPGTPGHDRLFFRVGGNGQIVAVNDTSIALGLLVLDTLHHPLSDIVVEWSVVSGPGRVDAADTTNATGLAQTRFFATADTGTRVIQARIGPDSVNFVLRVAPPCPVGTLAVGQVIDAVFPDGPCPHQELEMTLVAGQAYFISETHHPDPAHNNVDLVDPLMTLWQAFDPRPVRIDRSAFLAFSDDENGDFNSALFFVAPASGAYRIVAGSFANAGFGGYRLSLERCPVIVATADTGTQTYALPAIPPGTCRRDLPGGSRGYRFLSVPVALGEELQVTVTSADFTPAWELFTNWDSYESFQGPAIGNGLTRLAVPSVDGLATIAIAGTTENATGNFTVTLTRSVYTAPPTPRPVRPKLLTR